MKILCKIPVRLSSVAIYSEQTKEGRRFHYHLLTTRPVPGNNAQHSKPFKRLDKCVEAAISRAHRWADKYPADFHG